MSDFLDRVVSRALGRGPVLEPRLAPRYAPADQHLRGPEGFGPAPDPGAGDDVMEIEGGAAPPDGLPSAKRSDDPLHVARS